MEMAGAEAEADVIWWWAWAWRSVTAAACLLLALHVAEALWWRPRRLEAHFASQGVLGPPYRFLLGSVLEMQEHMAQAGAKPMSPQDSHDALPRVLPFYRHWRAKYGSRFLIWFGPTPRLTVADPALVQEVLLTRADAFDRYEAHPVVRQLEGDGLVSLHGDKWVFHRRVLKHAFFPDNLNRLVPHVGRSVAAIAEKWRTTATASSGGEVEVDVAEWFQAVAEEAITRTTFGRSYDSGSAVFGMQAHLMASASEAFRKVLVPGYRFLPTRKNRLSWGLDREIRRSLVELIGRRSEEAKDSGNGLRDVLGLMINCNSTSGGEEKQAIPVADMLEECKTFFFAGKQTTTNLLTWATVLLSMHTEWQERARREVIDVCGNDELPSRDHLPKLKTLGMILLETLRLYPPAVATIRRATRDVNLGGLLLPRDTELLIPIMVMHHDPKLWGRKAASFNPARFAGGASRAASHPQAFLPFGLGPRMCIGQNLALLEAKVTLAVLLRRFELRRSPRYVHAPTVLMLLYPQYGAPVIFKPLPPSPPPSVVSG